MIVLVSISSHAYKKESVTVNVDGKQRSMIVYSPSSTTASMPLMIVTHGMNQSPEYQSVGDAPNYDGGDRIWEMCDTAKLVVAYLRSDGNMWDTGGTKDINFVNNTIDELSKKFQINQNRIYWSGFSMGSMLIYATLSKINTVAAAEKLVNRIAAFAPTSGYQFGANPWNALKAKNKKINLIHHHSESDGVFYWDGRSQNGETPTWYLTQLANANGGTYAKLSFKSKEGNYTGTKEVWSNTTTGNVITFIHYPQGGHWPSWYNRKEIWGFCKQYSLLTIEEEYMSAYNKAKDLVDAWATNSEISAKTTYTSLKTALEKYGPDKVDTNNATSTNSAITKLNAYIKSFSATISNYKPTGQLAEQPSEFDPNFHIYLCFGQSNMEGNAAIESQDRTFVDPRFLMMSAVDMTEMNRTKYKWYVAYPPLCRGYNGLTPADYFGREMVANLPDSIKVGVINVAVGGASIKLFDEETRLGEINGAADWFKNYCKEYDNDPYKRLVDCAKRAQKVGVIKGILLHQGCTDNTQPDWPLRVKRVYLRLLNDLGLNESETPLLAGELLRQDMGGVCWGHNSVIARMSGAIPNAHVISSAKCPSASDGLHFTAEGYRMIGKRYAEKMLTLLGDTMKVDFDTTDNYFPFTVDAFNPSLNLQGTFKRTQTSTSTFYTFTSDKGFGGWRYTKGIDLSDAKYLVVTLLRSSNANPTIQIFDKDDYLSPCYSFAMKNNKTAVIDLQNMTDNNNNKIDPSHIYMIGFTLSQNTSIYINNVFLSDDGVNPTSVESLNIGSENVKEVYYDMMGRKVNTPTAGIYIKNGQKILIK